MEEGRLFAFHLVSSATLRNSRTQSLIPFARYNLIARWWTCSWIWRPSRSCRSSIDLPRVWYPLLVEPLRVVVGTGFRNIVVCGSCIPESVDKRYNGSALRVERTDFLAWQGLINLFPEILIRFGDRGVIYALEQDTSGPVKPPARIRLSTPTEHVLWRAPRNDHLRLSELVAASQDFDRELDAWGTTILVQCARFGKGKGGPTEWVARDTNLSTEVTVRAMESFLRQAARLSGMRFADPESYPWNQTLIDTQSSRSTAPARG